MSPAAAQLEPPRTASAEFLRAIPHEFARRHLILSEGATETGEEGLIVAERTRPAAIFNVGVRLGRTVRTRTEPDEVIAAAIDRAYHTAGSTDAPTTPSLVVQGATDVESELALAVKDSEGDVLNTTGKAPVVRLVDLLLFEALQRGASDVHIQPIRGRTLVRYRMDGVLHTVRELPGSLAAAVVSRVKVMGRLDVAETRAPQDGRAAVSVGGQSRQVDLRISTLPSTYGERVVMRLLDPQRSAHLLSFGALGMPPEVERKYLAQISRTSGIVLSTGPTGSGKTTTLYTSLAWVNSTNGAQEGEGGCELNMMTIEDPVEYDLSTAGLAVSQTQVDPKKHVTFSSGLRHILRQDPDVIMVGEVRDQETARIAVQASLTGHLVLSTLHTNDAASAPARLLDLGVEPFLVASSLSGVLAQRLVRRVHQECRGEGCPACLGTGHKGRTAVFELLVMDAPLRELVCRRAAATELKDAAQRAGMRTLRDEGQRLVRDGITTPQEVARVIESLDEEAA